MNRRRALKIGIDSGMTLTLLFLMAYALAGEQAHEWAGVLLFALFIAHHVLNAHWIKNLRRGIWSPYRIVQTVLIVLILLCMCALMFSGIVLSKHLFAFLEINGLTAAARTLHLLASFWGFALMSLHLGLHGGFIWGTAAARRRQRGRRRFAAAALQAAAVLCAVYGCAAFFRRGIASYMLYRTQFVFFDFDEPAVFFFADYAAVMWFFAFAAYAAAQGLKRGRTGLPAGAGE